MDSEDVDTKSKLDVEQLKRKILTMKKEIARKQRKLQKCKKVARIRHNGVDAGGNQECESNATTAATSALKPLDGLDIGLMGKERSTTHLKSENSKYVKSESSSATSTKGISDAVGELPKLTSCREDDEDAARSNGKDSQTENVEPAAIVTSQIMLTQGIEATMSASLRRSSRIPRESRVIASGDFLVGRNVRKRRASIESSEIDRLADGFADAKERTIFPGFPDSNESRYGCADFVLPDAEFASLKLQVRETKQLLNREITDLVNNRIEVSDVTIVTPTDENVSLKKVCQLTASTKRNEPIHMIHCGQLMTACSNVLSVVITIQLHWISTWIRESNEDCDDEDADWSLLKESKRDLESCQKTNIHGVETKEVVASVCILASKDKQRLTFWINSCDSLRRVTLRHVTVEPDFHVMTGVLLSSCSLSNVGDSCEITVANVWARTSRLKHASFDGCLRKVLTYRTLVEADDNLNSLVTIDGLESALLGTSYSKLFIWDRGSGQIVKTLEIKDTKFNCRSCVFCKAEKGLLFLGLFNQHTPTDECSLVVVNPNTSTWKTMGNFSPSSSSSTLPHRRSRRRPIEVDQDDANSVVQARKHGGFLVNVIRSAAVYVWRLTTGKQLVHIKNGHFDAATIYQSSGKSQTQLLVANQSGNVVVYSAR